MAKLSYIRDSTPPPKIAKGDVIATKILSYEIVKSNYKNNDGSDKFQVKFQLEYNGYTFPSWMGYYRNPFRVAKIAKLNEAFVEATNIMTNDIDDFLRKLSVFGLLYVECTEHRIWEDQEYPKFTVVATKLPPRQTALPEQPIVQSMRRIRFIKFYGAYNVGDEVDILQTIADDLIEKGQAVPVDKA